MSIVLVRVDDRLIHGQVVVGWGSVLAPGRIILADDDVASRDWEQELYRVGAPPEVSVEFHTVAEAARHVETWERSPERTIVLVGDVESLVRLCDGAPEIRCVNLGGIHKAGGRTERLSYLFLSETESEQLAGLVDRGIDITAQDLPTATKVGWDRIG